MTEQPNKQPNVPVTHIRLLIPPGMSVSEVISAVDISFQEAPPAGEAPPPGAQETSELGSTPEIRPSVCCVDAAVISSVSTVSLE